MTKRRTLKRAPLRPELERLLREARLRGPMTPAQRRAQRISFAYGNCSISNPRITRGEVERLHDEMYGEGEG